MSWDAGFDDMVSCAFFVSSMEGETLPRSSAPFIVSLRGEWGRYGVGD